MPCCDAAPRSSSDAVAVVPRLHPVRDAQAWDGGCEFGATARSSAGEEWGPSLATPKEPETDTAGELVAVAAIRRINSILRHFLSFSDRRRHARAPLDEITDVVEVHDPSDTPRGDIEQSSPIPN
ncbi:hypothetical protein EV715DRAFT_298327, partial [Schizophyllum commune]